MLESSNPYDTDNGIHSLMSIPLNETYETFISSSVAR